LNKAHLMQIIGFLALPILRWLWAASSIRCQNVTCKRRITYLDVCLFTYLVSRCVRDH